MNKILRTKEEPPVLRHVGEKNLIQAQVDKNVAEFVTRAIWREVTMDDMRKWGLAPGGELRPDTTGNVSKSLGSAVWEIIHSLAI